MFHATSRNCSGKEFLCRVTFVNECNTSPASIWCDIRAYCSVKKTSYPEDLCLLESFAHIPTGGTCSIIQLLHFESKLLVVQQESGRLRE